MSETEDEKRRQWVAMFKSIPTLSHNSDEKLIEIMTEIFPNGLPSTDFIFQVKVDLMEQMINEIVGYTG